MKKALKIKNQPVDPIAPARTPTVKQELPKPADHLPERHKNAGGKGPKSPQ